jgi:TRAP-type C4-dicarboxylate transport system permease small subunit
MRHSVMQLLSGLLIVLMSALVGAVVWQVLSRYLLAEPSVWTEELARFLLIWVGILGSVYAYHTQSHLSVDLWSPRLTALGKKRLIIVQGIVVVAFALSAMVFGGLRLVWITYTLQQMSPALGMPMAAVYAVVPLGGGMIMWLAVHDTVRSLLTLSSAQRPTRGEGSDG